MPHPLVPALLLLAQSAAPPTPPPAAAPAHPADIVVLARRLRRLRLRYESDGRFLRWCHPEKSSGDRGLDHLGCQVLGACIRRGYDEPDEALACIHRFQARLDAIAEAQEDAGAAARPSGNGQ